MRTTITLDPELLRAAKQRAMEQRTTLRAVIESALRLTLFGAEQSDADEPFELVTFRGKGPWPGVNLDRVSELYDIDDR